MNDEDEEVAKLRAELAEARQRMARQLAQRDQLITRLKEQGMRDDEIEPLLNPRDDRTAES